MKIEIDQLGRTGWERLADQAEALIQQRWDYGEAARAKGRLVRRATFRNGKEVIGIAQVLGIPLGRFGISTCLAGPLWISDGAPDLRVQAMETLARAAPFKGPFVMAPMAAQDPSPRKMTRVMSGATLARVSLSGDAAALRARLKGKWRNRLVAAEASALKLRHETGSLAQINGILTQEALQRTTRRYRGLPLFFIRILAEAQPGQMRLFSALHSRTVCAQMLHFCHGNTATYLMGWNDETGRQMQAHTLLMWHAMTALQSRGIRQIDLGPIDTQKAEGLARFKLGTGAEALRLGSTFARVLPLGRQTVHEARDLAPV